MVLSREDLWNQLKRGELAPVYTLFGVETFLRDKALKTIADTVFDTGDLRDFNDTTFSLNVEGNLEKAVAASSQLPMMSRRRLIRITDVRVSQTGFRDTLTEEDEALLSSYLAQPVTDAVIIFIADELNGVRKMGKFLRDKTAAINFEPLNERQLLEYARKEFAAADLKVTEPQVRSVVGRIGSDVRHLSNEINKLAAAALPGDTLTDELIEALVPDSSELDNFAFTNELLAGRPQRAVALLEKTLDDGAEPIALIGTISYKYRTLMIIKDMMARGLDRREVASAAKMRYTDQEAFFAAARRSDVKKLARALERIAETDLAIKTSVGGSGPAASRMQIEKLVCELAQLSN
ncbi:MAG: DNA polymerase III subunit delta [Acidobacteria bacterium]|nr:DNA polymerase III subunit delta [Acidobacteriota bacterium]